MKLKARNTVKLVMLHLVNKHLDSIESTAQGALFMRWEFEWFIQKAQKAINWGLELGMEPKCERTTEIIKKHGNDVRSWANTIAKSAAN